MNSPLSRSRFSKYLVDCNNLHVQGFTRWVFYRGMLFNAREKWWGHGGNRNNPHEGLDLCFYLDTEGRFRRLTAGVRVPVMYSGEVVKIEDDFLGKSVYMRHDLYDARGNRLCTIYGHTAPDSHVHTGTSLGEGDVFAALADAGGKRVKAPPHLHISVAWVPVSITDERLGWKVVSDPDVVSLVDPLELLACEYEVVESAP